MWRKPSVVGMFVALFIAIGATMAGTVAPAAAAGTCDEVVVDGAGVFKDQLAQIQSRANTVANLGADVRIRTVASIGTAATLDSYERGVERGCPSWQASDGGRKNNLIVLMVAIEQRTTGLYYGGQWESALGSSWPRIQGDLMNPRFRDGDFAGGVNAGLQEIYRVVDLQLHPQNAPAAQPHVQPAASPSADYSGLGRAVAILLVLALVLGGAALLLPRRQGGAAHCRQRERARPRHDRAPGPGGSGGGGEGKRRDPPGRDRPGRGFLRVASGRRVRWRSLLPGATTWPR
jgi:uncharacterized membrane protein YgcG